MHGYGLAPPAYQILWGTFDLLRWYGTNKAAVAVAKPSAPTTYYAKISKAIEVTEQADSLEADRGTLTRVKRFLDDNLDDKSKRAAVLTALRGNKALARARKAEIRRTVASAWTAAMAEASDAPSISRCHYPRGL